MLDHPNFKPALIYGLLGCSLAINLVILLDRKSDEPAPAASEVPTEPAVAPGTQELALVDVAAGSAPIAAPAPVAAAPSGPVTLSSGDWSVVSSEIKGSISRTFQLASVDKADALSAVYARLFVWDVDLRRDLQRGDSVDVMYRIASDGNPEVAAARMRSQKLGRVASAYRWQAPGDAFPSYWSEAGVEVPYRLKDSPLRDYEQITSLLKDRPTHEGMDFKTPIGTEALSGRPGVVTRINWNWTANGNCVEVRYNDGVLAKFLHLSEDKVAVGDHVTQGQVIGLTGNTGHSTAPHLHYQLSLGDKVIDPIDYHGALRRKLNPEAMTAFNQEMARLDGELGRAVAAR